MKIQTGDEMRDAEGKVLGRVVAEEGEHVKIADQHGKHYWVPGKLIREEDGTLVADQAIDRQARIVDSDPGIDLGVSSGRVEEASKESFPASDPPGFNPDKP